jgi:hypothetical protein
MFLTIYVSFLCIANKNCIIVIKLKVANKKYIYISIRSNKNMIHI